MAKQEEIFSQVNVSLPAALLAFVRQQAAAKDHTISGAIRHLISEAARLEPPPLKPFGTVLPEVHATVASIAEARDLIAEWTLQRARIERRRKNFGGGSAADDDLDERLRGQIEIIQSRIEVAERMMKKPNGARKHG